MPSKVGNLGGSVIYAVMPTLYVREKKCILQQKKCLLPSFFLIPVTYTTKAVFKKVALYSCLHSTLDMEKRH